MLAAGAQRLADKGIVSPIAAGLGMLAVRDAARIDGPDAELLVVVRRGSWPSRGV